eukprot:157590-Hanusia_phi.AAC.2
MGEWLQGGMEVDELEDRELEHAAASHHVNRTSTFGKSQKISWLSMRWTFTRFEPPQLDVSHPFSQTSSSFPPPLWWTAFASVQSSSRAADLDSNPSPVLGSVRSLPNLR